MFEISAPETLRGEKPRLLRQVHEAIRRLHYSRRTEEAYVHWIKRFIFWSGKRHPSTLGEVEVSAFLSHLAVELNVAAATQNQALSALLFLYKQVLGGGVAVARCDGACEAPGALAGGAFAGRGGGLAGAT